MDVPNVTLPPAATESGGDGAHGAAVAGEAAVDHGVPVVNGGNGIPVVHGLVGAYGAPDAVAGAPAKVGPAVAAVAGAVAAAGTAVAAGVTTTASAAVRIDLMRVVSRRLFIALSILLVFFLVGAVVLTRTWMSDSVLTVPLVVIACGAVGGFISIQRKVSKMAENDLRLLSGSWVYICLTPLVGSVLALVAYMVFVSRLLTGDVFPEFEVRGVPRNGILSIFDQTATGGYVGYAKLIVWSFVAGYSENFVTNVIGRFEDRG